MWPVSVVGRRTNEYNRVIWSWTKNNSERQTVGNERDSQTTEARQTNRSERGAAESRNNNNINNNKHKQTKTQREKKKQKTTD